MGAVAIRIHCPKFVELLDAMNRSLTDLDLMGYSKQRLDTIKMFQDRGKLVDKSMLLLNERLRFLSPPGEPDIDVFLDELRMCHTISLKDRLALDSPTIPLADLLLEKMQIVKINEKDLKDSIVLLREHAIADVEKEAIDSQHICKTLANDWGFYYTVTMNLKKLLDLLPTYSALSENDVKDVSSKTTQLLEQIEKTPKSTRWKMRAKIGTKAKWYQDVDESPQLKMQQN